MMSLFDNHVLAASWHFGDLLEIIIVVIVVIIAPLAQVLIKFFSPKPKQGEDVKMARPMPPQHRMRPTAQAMPMDRVPTPPAPPVRLARPLARPLPSGSSGPALERVRPLAAETVPAEPVARRVVDDDEASRLLEMLLEMLGVPAEELRRRVPQDRQEQQQRQQRQQAAREAKTSAARPKLSPPPPARRTQIPSQEPEKHVSIHSRLPSEGRSEAALPSRAKMQRAPDGAAAAGVSAPSARGLTRLARADRHELRRAILLNEVLGPPVSMRPPRDFPD